MFEPLKVQKFCLTPFWNRRVKLDEVQANSIFMLFFTTIPKLGGNFFVPLMVQMFCKRS
jgi:hypothetical protein